MSAERAHSARWRVYGMAGFCAAVLAASAWLALHVDAFVKGWAFAMPGTTDSALAPATFPRMILWLVAALAAANLVSLLAGAAATRAPGEARASGAEPEPEPMTGPATPLRVAAVIAGCLLYVWSLPSLGYMLASCAAIALGAWAVGYRRLPELVLTAAIVPPATWYAFRYGMKVLLPEFDAW